jgi:hypothetical protein
MLTQVTAARTTRELTNSGTRKTPVEVHLLLYRRLKDTAIHDAKRSLNGLPTRIALLERAWVEQYSQPGWPGWETSFQNCCLMLNEDPSEERVKALKEIDRVWRKSLVDWGRKRWQKALEEIETLKAGESPAWCVGRSIQDELPLMEGEC